MATALMITLLSVSASAETPRAGVREVVRNIITSNGFDAVISPDGRTAYAVTMSSTHTNWGGVEIIDTATDTRTGRVQNINMRDGAQSVAIAPRGDIMYVSYVSGAIGVVDLQTRREVRRIDAYDAGWGTGRLAISPDGTRMYVAHLLGAFRVIDLETEQQIGEVALARGEGHVAISADGTTVYAHDSSHVYAIDAETFAVSELPMKREYQLRALTVTPDGEKLLVASGAGTVYIFDTSTHEQVAVIRDLPWNASSLDVSPDGTFALLGTQVDGIWMLDLETVEASGRVDGVYDRMTMRVAFKSDKDEAYVVSNNQTTIPILEFMR